MESLTKWAGVGGFEGTVKYDVEADKEDGRESTSIGEDSESPKETGEDGRERMGIVSEDDAACSSSNEVLLFIEDGGDWDDMGEHR
jgi:hypothetical protein